MKKIPVKELDAILAEVSAQLEPVVKAEVQRAAEKLSKAHPGESTTDEVPKDDSATKEAPADEASAPPKSDPPASEPPAAEPPAAEPPAPEVPGDEPPADPALDPGADGDIDSPEALQAAYSTLPLEELQVHYMAVKAALYAAMPPAVPAPEAAIAAPPVAAPPVAAPPAVPPMADPALKAEMPADPNGSVEAVKKSEKRVEDLIKTLAERDSVIAQLIESSAALKKHIERPLRKSVATLSEVRRPSGTPAVDFASLSKSEMKVLVRKTIEKPLSANDRARMHDFINGKYEDVESVKDLLA